MWAQRVDRATPIHAFGVALPHQSPHPAGKFADRRTERDLHRRKLPCFDIGMHGGDQAPAGNGNNLSAMTAVLKAQGYVGHGEACPHDHHAGVGIEPIESAWGPRIRRHPHWGKSARGALPVATTRASPLDRLCFPFLSTK